MAIEFKSKSTMAKTCIELAQKLADSRSKDPNTKVGACCYDPLTGTHYLGYNGFPPGFPEYKSIWENRNPDEIDCKYNIVVHAEANAIRKASMSLGSNVSRCMLYVTHFPCKNCMKDWIASFGIKIVYYLDEYPNDKVSKVIALNMNIELIKIED
jgi:dCMP deaminase